MVKTHRLFIQFLEEEDLLGDYVYNTYCSPTSPNSLNKMLDQDTREYIMFAFGWHQATRPTKLNLGTFWAGISIKWTYYLKTK